MFEWRYYPPFQCLFHSPMSWHSSLDTTEPVYTTLKMTFFTVRHFHRSESKMNLFTRFLSFFSSFLLSLMASIHVFQVYVYSIFTHRLCNFIYILIEFRKKMLGMHQNVFRALYFTVSTKIYKHISSLICTCITPRRVIS